MNSLELKIKRITIAAEARGIRINERRLRRKLLRLTHDGTGQGEPPRHERAFAGALSQFKSLRDHRLTVVRPEARAMHLAHTFLRGWEYMEVEPISHLHLRTATFDATWSGIMERVEYHVLRHAEGDQREVKQRFAAWADAGKEYARNPELQAPALELARRGSLAAKEARRLAYREKMRTA